MKRRYVEITLVKKGIEWIVEEYSPDFLEATDFTRRELTDRFGDRFLAMLSSGDMATAGEFFSKMDEGYSLCPWIFTLSCASEGGSIPVLLQTVAPQPDRIRLRIHSARFLGEQVGQMGRRIRSLEDSIPNGLCQVLYDDGFTVIWHNEGFLDILGYSEEQFVGELYGKAAGYIYPEDLPGIKRWLEEAANRGGRAFTTEMRIRRRDGEVRTVLASFSFTGESRNGVPVLYSYGVDLTEEKRAHALELESERMRMAMAQTSSSLLEYDIVQHTLLSSEGLTRCLGVAGDARNVPESMIQSGRVASGSVDVLRSIFRQIDEGQERVEGVVCLRDGDKPDKWLRLRLISLFREAGWPVKAVLLTEDITERYQVELRYREEENRRAAMTYDMDFSWQADLSEEKILAANRSKFPFFDFERSDSSGELIRRTAEQLVHPEDRAEYLKKLDRAYMLRMFEEGVPEITLEFRRETVAGSGYLWCRGVVHIIQEPLRGNVCAYIYTKDIDGEKRRELELRRHAEQDALTGLYNRYTLELLCDELLEKKADKGCAAMYMLDLDNFKYLNDTFGHVRGDEMLRQTAEALEGIFGSGALLGRLGGDELAALEWDCPDSEAVKARAQSICDILQDLTAGTGVVTASVGVACAPVDGRTFSELYHCADSALYQAKREGKNRWTIYNKPDREGESESRLAVSRDWLLEESGDIVYVSDFYSYDLLYMNENARKLFGQAGGEYLGKKCYEVIQHLDRPCDFCTNHMLCREEFYRWEYRNPVLDRTFLLRDRIVDWYGTPARIELANDVSVLDRRNRVLEEQIRQDSVIISCLRALSGTKSLVTNADTVLRQLGELYGADRAFILDYDPQKDIILPRYQWCRPGVVGIPPRAEGICPDGRLRERLLRRENYSYDQEKDLRDSPGSYHSLLRETGVVCQRCAPIYINSRPAGVVGIDNPTVSQEDLTALETMGYFISEELSRSKLSESLSFLSYHDSLTGLWNRNRYVEYMETLNAGRVHALGVAVADLNALKEINKLRGHAEGDVVVRRAADLLREAFPGAEIFRLSGDEFVVHCENLPRMDFLAHVKRVRERSYLLQARGISVGHAWTDKEIDCGQLTMQATDIMLMQKREYYQHQREEYADGKHGGARLRELMDGLRRGDYRVYLQPKAGCADFRLCGAEALARFYSPKEGLVSPNRFIPMLEEERMVRYLDLYIFEEVCRLLDRWRREGRELLTISLNFSRQTVLEPDLLKTLVEITDRYRVPREYIEVEITETLGEYESSTIAEIGAGIKSIGFRLALDDFGSHYTNMAMLSAVPADVLKLDRSLVRDVMTGRSNQLVLKSILTLCKELGIASIAEGVETQEQFQLLRALRCDYIQGFLFGPPVTVEEFEETFLAERAASHHMGKELV